MDRNGFPQRDLKIVTQRDSQKRKSSSSLLGLLAKIKV